MAVMVDMVVDMAVMVEVTEVMADIAEVDMAVVMEEAMVADTAVEAIMVKPS